MAAWIADPDHRPAGEHSNTDGTQAQRRIEHSPLWVRDVGLDTDHNRYRADHGPQNLVILRELARHAPCSARPEISIRHTRVRCGWSGEVAGSGLGEMRLRWGTRNPGCNRGWSWVGDRGERAGVAQG